MHSSKARKLDVIAQLHKAWKAQGEVDPEEWRARAVKLKHLRDELNQYVERLHRRHRNGLSIYKAIGIVVDGEGVPSLRLSWDSPEAHGIGQLDALRAVAERLELNAGAVGVDQWEGGKPVARWLDNDHSDLPCCGGMTRKRHAMNAPVGFPVRAKIFRATGLGEFFAAPYTTSRGLSG